MEKLPGTRKYLEASIGYTTSLETCHHLLQKAPGQANRNLSTNRLYFANSQAKANGISKYIKKGWAFDYYLVSLTLSQ